MQNTHRKIFLALFLSIFCAVIGIGIVVPLLPIYAQDLGASGLYIALIFSSFSISRTFLIPLFGKLSDKKGRKPFIVTGLFLYAVVSFGFIIAGSVTSLIAIRFIQGIASAMIMPVTQAYIGDITPKGKEGFFMGLFNLSTFFGLSIGPVLGGVIKDSFGYSFAFICMGVLCLIAFFVSLFFLPHNDCKKKDIHNVESKKIISILKDKMIIGLFVFRFVYTTSIGVVWCFLPIFAHDKFNMSSSGIGILVMLGVFISGILNIPMGYLADRLNKTVMIIVGGVIVCCGVYSLKMATESWHLACANIAFGIGGGISMPSVMALAVIKGNDVGAMGSVMGVLTMSHSLGMLIGAILAGISMDYLTIETGFLFCSWIMFTGTLICFIIMLYDRKYKKTGENKIESLYENDEL